MNKTKSIKTKMSVSLGILAALVFVPSSASAAVTISDNGAFSDNYVRYDVEKNVDVRQANNTSISNDVQVSNNTGHNQAYGNTGGGVKIETGDTDANIHISNQAGLNMANISGCGECNGDNEDIWIKNNGAFSDNSVYYSSDKTVSLNQRNDTDIDNNVDVDNNTGHNTASGNTSSYWWNPSYGGDVDIKTGDANANVTIKKKCRRQRCQYFRLRRL